MQGLYYWAFIGLLIADLSISISDFSVENRSRRKFGGLPTGEYILHVILAMLFGAMVACIITETRQWGSMQTKLILEPPDLPLLLRTVMGIMSIIVFISGLQDAIAAYRLGNRDEK